MEPMNLDEWKREGKKQKKRAKKQEKKLKKTEKKAKKKIKQQETRVQKENEIKDALKAKVAKSETPTPKDEP